MISLKSAGLLAVVDSEGGGSYLQKLLAGSTGLSGKRNKLFKEPLLIKQANNWMCFASDILNFQWPYGLFNRNPWASTMPGGGGSLCAKIKLVGCSSHVYIYIYSWKLGTTKK